MIKRKDTTFKNNLKANSENLKLPKQLQIHIRFRNKTKQNKTVLVQSRVLLLFIYLNKFANIRFLELFFFSLSNSFKDTASMDFKEWIQYLWILKNTI